MICYNYGFVSTSYWLNIVFFLSSNSFQKTETLVLICLLTPTAYFLPYEAVFLIFNLLSLFSYLGLYILLIILSFILVPTGYYVLKWTLIIGFKLTKYLLRKLSAKIG